MAMTGAREMLPVAEHLGRRHGSAIGSPDSNAFTIEAATTTASVALPATTTRSICFAWLAF
jgi:hypothetical protein